MQKTCIRNQTMYTKSIKRILDIILSCVGIITLLPAILATAFFVRIKLGSPVIFKQKRPGRDGKIFEMYKFRSMTEQRDSKGNLLPDETRLTAFGKKLRASSLDELPELFNILKGDMSVVGPRPQLVRDMVFMTSKQKERHSVLPGLTGLAQINGRNNISWEEKFQWDLQYVNHVSFRMDTLILVKTVLKVLCREDIATDGMETAEDLGDYLLRTGKITKQQYEIKQKKSKELLQREFKKGQMKKRVLILVNHDVVVYNFRKELVEQLIHEGNEVYLSSPYGERIDLLRKMGSFYIKTEINRHGANVIEDLKLLFHYISIIRKLKPDIILTYTIKPNIYGGMAARICNVPYVVNITGLGTALEHKGILQFITVNLYKIALKKVGVIFFQNEENRLFFEKRRIAQKKYELLPGSGVNLEDFVPLPYPSDKEIHFVMIARIMKEKGIEEYLSAAIYLRKRYPNTFFHICGFCEEKYIDRLNQMQEENLIIYHGMVKDIRNVLKITHCTIHPSYYPEGLSNALLESSACARPVITTDRSGCREVVDDGQNGYMVPCRDVKKLIAAIERFISLSYEEKRQMGLRGRKKTEHLFDRRLVVEKYMEAINQLCN